jgi:predicted N-acetyltransferase YhbS
MLMDVSERTLALFGATEISEEHDECSIRNGPADDESWKTIKDVILEICPENANAIQRELAALKHSGASALRARLFTAWREGTVVGTTLMATTFASHELIQMSWVIVCPAHRAQGIGKALASAAFSFADKAGLAVYGVSDSPEFFEPYGVTALPFDENRWLCVRKKSGFRAGS